MVYRLPFFTYITLIYTICTSIICFVNVSMGSQVWQVEFRMAKFFYPVLDNHSDINCNVWSFRESWLASFG